MMSASTTMARNTDISAECCMMMSSYSNMQMGMRKCSPSLSVVQKDGSSDLDRPRSPSLQASTWVIQSRPA